MLKVEFIKLKIKFLVQLIIHFILGLVYFPEIRRSFIVLFNSLSNGDETYYINELEVKWNFVDKIKYYWGWEETICFFLVCIYFIGFCLIILRKKIGLYITLFFISIVVIPKILIIILHLENVFPFFLNDYFYSFLFLGLFLLEIYLIRNFKMN